MLEINNDEQTKKVTTNYLSPSHEAQVVIVGAGLAGLAAAQRLHEAGVEDVVMLDAQTRIGGRVHTINHSDYLIELGAQWLHGADENPLYKWLVEKNMLNDFESASKSLEGMFCDQFGKELDSGFVKRVIDILVDIKLSMSKNRYSEFIGSSGLKNAAQVFEHQLEDRISREADLSSRRQLVFAIFDWFLRYETIENGASSMDDVSVASYTDWTDWGDGTLLNFKDGYHSLLVWFCRHMPSDKWIHLAKEVISIEMLESDRTGFLSGETGLRYDKPILVRYRQLDDSLPRIKVSDMDIDNNNNNNEMICDYVACDHVVVTVSLGFLKKNHLSFFKPPLPHAKRRLIDSLGYGTVNKIILQFDVPFWDPNHGIKLVWTQGERDDFPRWTHDIISFDSLRNQPNLLIGWIGGQGAKMMEQYTDNELADTCYRLLQRFIPESHSRPTKLISCICSRWNSNPFICGSYSFQSIGSFELNVDKLHEPIYNSAPKSNRLVCSSMSRVPRILFAGEATAGKLYSTTHGAIISGWREADRLTGHLRGGEQSNLQTAARGSLRSVSTRYN